MAESRQRWQVLRRWRGQSPQRLAVLAVLGVFAVLAGVVWWWGVGGLAVAAGIVLIGGLIVWAVVMPGRLAPPLRGSDLAGVRGKDRLEAIDARTRLHYDLRNGVLQLLTVLAVLAGAVVGFQQLAEDRDQAREQLTEDHDKALQDRQLTRQGQASERFTRAIGQLGSTTAVETRIGGIFGLDQIAEQAPENTGPVAEVLLAWLNSRPRPRPRPTAPLREHAPDVQAALTVLTRQRYSSIVANRLDLRNLGLRWADLRNANLTGANLKDTDLSYANLNGANLTKAQLYETNLTYADLRGINLTNVYTIKTNLSDTSLIETDLHDVDLSGVILYEAHLEGANLAHADLIGTDLYDANLNGADLTGANLTKADLYSADLTGANLSGADLTGARLAGADLQGATVDGNTKPLGFDWRQAGARVVAP